MSGTKPRHLGAVLALLAFAQMIIAIDYNIVFVSLPEIGTSLGFSAQNLQWVVSAYAVAFGGFLLLGGRATDLFGRKNMFILGMFLYAVSSLAGGLAGEPWMLIVARAVQGLGGAFLAPATLSLVTTLFAEGAERNRALSVWGGAGGSGMVLGSILGGLLTDWFGWSAVFYVNVLMAGAGLIAAFILLPETERSASSGFDLPGAVLGTVASTLLVFGLVQGPDKGWTAPVVIWSLVVAVVLFALFVVVESKTASPLVPLRLFRNRNLSTGTVITFLFMATFGALAYFLTLLWQTVQGYSAWATGFAFVVPSGLVLVGTIVGGKAATKLGARNTLLLSLALGVVGTVALALVIGAGRPYLALVVPLAVLSLGQGMVFTTMFAAASTGVPAQDQGIGGGIATTGQQIGGAVGLAVLIALAGAFNGTDAAQDPAQLVDGIKAATWAIAAGIALTVLAALNLRSTPAVAAESAPEPELASEHV
ncbi:MFS transporter [Streptomyces sp. WELS2]|uniref:MFS transporter n=1 Tax=Streptomyces sp. WELS2 TaxID=2749435 RepID=UPI00286839E7|nr:MFS transporter [Streptomyces sp. WELS2]